MPNSLVSHIQDNNATNLQSRSYIKRLSVRNLLLICIILFIITLLIRMFIYVCLEHCNDDSQCTLLSTSASIGGVQKAAVCADAPLCTGIGKDILAENGSAVDAAIATLFCNGLINMHSMGIGGGFLMTIYKRNERKAYTLNAREVAPFDTRVDTFNTNVTHLERGPFSVAVPGELRGYAAAHKKFGNLPWQKLVEPTIRLCKSGYKLTNSLRKALSSNNDTIMKDVLLKKWFVDPKTNKYRTGKISPNEYCKTLELIAKYGSNTLYIGGVSLSLREDIRDMGGLITFKDLFQYKTTWESPISIKMRNRDIIYSVPPPGAGVLLSLILNILDEYSFSSENIKGIKESALTIHRIIESFKYAYAHRMKLGDPKFSKDVSKLVEKLISKDYAALIRQKIDDSQTFKDWEHYDADLFNQPNHGTSHISVIAQNGDAVSVTSTLNLHFGAGITSKRTGIVLNSCMNEFSTKASNRLFDSVDSRVNFAKPQKRPQSSMAPTIIVDQKGDVRVVIGASGGTKITTAITFVLVRYLWFGQSIKEAINAPRFHHQLIPMKLEKEDSNSNMDVISSSMQRVVHLLRTRGHVTAEYNGRGSAVYALVVENGTVSGSADNRHDGNVNSLD